MGAWVAAGVGLALSMPVAFAQEGTPPDAIRTVRDGTASKDDVQTVLNNTARINGNLFVRYAPQPWYAEVGVTHLGKRHYWNGNTEQHLPGFTRVDAMVGFTRAPWTFTAAVQNVFDKQYWRSSAMPGSPRALMVKANYEF